MEKSNIRREHISILVILFFFIVGAFGHSFSQTKEYFLSVTFFTLALFCGIILYFTLKNSNRTFKVWLILSYILTLTIEIIGVKTGNIFGHYFYGDPLGFKILEVPIIIGINWVITILGAIKLSEYFFKKNKFLIVASSSILLVLFDIIMEPAAIHLNYWKWKNIQPPLQNYAAWLIITLIFSSLYYILKANTNSKSSAYFFLIEILFFTIILLFTI
jgi:putative membrane protein